MNGFCRVFSRTLLAVLLFFMACGPLRAAVYINEFMADNPGRPNDPNAQLDMDGKSPGWIELRNDGASAVTLTGWALSDDPLIPGKWVFAAPAAPATTHTTIPANGFKLVFCGGLARNVANVEPHPTFKIDNAGVLLLSQPDGSGGWNVVSQIGTSLIKYPNQRKAISYGYPGNDPNQAPVFFESDTPGGTNGATGVATFCKDTKFDISRGFYDTPFTLNITSSTPGATIAYTLNGSVPTATNGTQVPAADAAATPVATLSITGTTIVRAVAHKSGLGSTNIDTQTYLFASQVLAQSGPLPSMGLAAGDTYNWGASGGTNIGGPDWAVDPDIVNHAVVANRLTADDLKSLPVVSLVVPWRETFGPQNTTGVPVDQRGFYVGAEVGVANEGADRYGSLEYFNPGGNPADPNLKKGFQTDGNVHVFGGTSQQRWKSYKLSMRFKAQENVNYNVYGDETSPSQDLFILDARLNQAWVHPDATQRSRGDYVRDHVMADLQQQMGTETFHSQPTHLFLNGLYWGLYILHEKPDEKFTADYLGGSKSDWDVFKHSATGGTDGGTLFGNVVNSALLDPSKALGSTSGTTFSNCTTLKNYEDLLDLLGLGVVAPNPAPNLTVQANYEAVAAKLDLVSFVDYILVNVVAANNDWPHKNYYASFNRTDPAGKWRFHSWDAEHVFRAESENALNSGNWNGDSSGPGALFRKLAVNAEFRSLVADRAHKHLFNGGTLSLENLQAVFGARLGEIEPSGVRGESARWGDNRQATPYNYVTNWSAEKNRILTTVLPGRAGLGASPSYTALNQLKAFTVSGTPSPMYPSVAAPVFRNAANSQVQHGGNVAMGFSLQLFNPGATGGATTYYTLDGSDPREAYTGNVAAGALAYSAPLPLMASGHVNARILTGGNWSALNAAYFFVDAEPASAANLVVSKIHYHPAALTAAELAAGFTDRDQFEFIELMNIGATGINLLGVTCGSGFDYTFTESSAVRELAAGARVLIVRDRAAFDFRNGVGLPVAGEFQLGTGLSNSGERLHFKAANGVTIKDFVYDDVAPWPTTPDGGGPSLVLMHPATNPDHTVAAHWRPSSGGAQPNADDRVFYADWRAQAFTGPDATDDLVSGPAVDPNGNGYANLLEFGMGLDPLAPSTAPDPVAVTFEIADLGVGPERLIRLAFRRNPAAEEVAWTIQAGITLDDFAPVPFTQEGTTLQNGDGTETVTWLVREPLAGNLRRFFRLQGAIGVP